MTIDTTYVGGSATAPSDLQNKIGERLDNGRHAAADGIAAAAWRLEGHAEELPGGERVAKFAHSAADTLTTMSDYIREHDGSAMFEDAKTLVKNNPVPAVLGAAAIGFLLAKAFARH